MKLRRTFIEIVLWHDCFAIQFTNVILVHSICRLLVLVYADSSSYQTFNTYSTFGVFQEYAQESKIYVKIALKITDLDSLPKNKQKICKKGERDLKLTIA